MTLLIFDLDGTLIDSRLDLANSVNASRAHLGLAAISNESVYSYVGNGAPVLMRRALGNDASESEVRTALEFFLAYYGEHMLDSTTLYPGVRDALDRLRAHEVSMAVLTNKPVRMSVAIVDGLGLANHFKRVYGGNSFEFKKPHGIGIDTLVLDCGASKDGTIMVGDSAVDVQTARNAGVRACGVTYGFQPETFARNPPDFLVDALGELADRVIDE
ncbi:MAG: HAD hydrolase-like protein [Acidobacteriota bacterium]|nr:HAD hydrolase-like protein [Acidobacteriota bacterium]